MRGKAVIAVEIACREITGRFDDPRGDMAVPRGKVGQDCVQECALDTQSDDAAAERKADDLAVDGHGRAYEALVAEAVADVTGRKPSLSTGGGTSDARFIKKYCPVAEFGIIGKTAHQIDEHVAVKDMVALTEIYKEVIKAFFA